MVKGNVKHAAIYLLSLSIIKFSKHSCLRGNDLCICILKEIWEHVFSFLGHYIGTELCCSEQSLDCDGLVVVMASFRIFLEKNYAFFILLPSTSTSSFVCPVCSCFCSTDAGLPRKYSLDYRWKEGTHAAVKFLMISLHLEALN